MAYARLLNTIPTELKNCYRKYESTSKKVINNNWSIEFNSICLQENILPNFTRIRHHDPAVSSTRSTLEYRRYLVEREISEGKKRKLALEDEQRQYLNDIQNHECDSRLKHNVTTELDSILENSDRVCKTRIIKKLNSLYLNGNPGSYHRSLFIKEHKNQFVNFSNYVLDEFEIEFLNLGINCHIQPKYDKLQKSCELEILYQSLLQLESKNAVRINPDLAEQLRCESTKHRNVKHTSILSKPLKDAAQRLKSNNEIVIRKADKSATYVILDRVDYLSKLNVILSDTTKFRKIDRDITAQLKQKANKLIETQNAVTDQLKLNKIIGDYQPGYIYGNVKIHKANNPLRPIISQIPTPTYQLAKSLNKVISPYMPKDYLLSSTNDFIDLLHSSQSEGLIASLDVENLFTNVPIDETIEIILKHVYNNPELGPPKMPKEILKELLELCTKESIFRCPSGNLYQQIDGVAMGSPLGPTFANFYMGNLEQHIFQDSNKRPNLYARYVDDIFVQIKDFEELIKLQNLFQSSSVLMFTYEMNVNDKLPFLDVNVDASEQNFKTTVYHKPTSQGNCLNAQSECIERYKTSVINNFLTRAYKISQNWHEFHNEIIHIKQMLINNNFSNRVVDHQVKKFIDLKFAKEDVTQKSCVPIYFQNQTHKNSLLDERIIRDIVHKNTKCLDEDKKLKLVFYYKNKKSSNFVMKNNLIPPPTDLQQTNVIYKFQCPMPHSQAVEYVGFTQTTLSRRLTCHAQNGSILKHFVEYHKCKPSREQLTENTRIIGKESDRYKLAIKEALTISKLKPIINKQFDNFSTTLKLYSLGNGPLRQCKINLGRDSNKSAESSGTQLDVSQQYSTVPELKSPSKSELHSLSKLQQKPAPHSRSRSQTRSRSQSPSCSPSKSRSQSKSRSKMGPRSQLGPLSRSQSTPWTPVGSKSQTRSKSMSQSKSLSRSKLHPKSQLRLESQSQVKSQINPNISQNTINMSSPLKAKFDLPPISSQELPCMSQVLRHFGISPTQTEVSTQSYSNSILSNVSTFSSTLSLSSPTISQRIDSLLSMARSESEVNPVMRSRSHSETKVYSRSRSHLGPRSHIRSRSNSPSKSLLQPKSHTQSLTNLQSKSNSKLKSKSTLTSTPQNESVNSDFHLSRSPESFPLLETYNATSYIAEKIKIGQAAHNIIPSIDANGDLPSVPSQELPSMSQVLPHFGVEPTQPGTPNHVSSSIDKVHPKTQSSQTISQRIKSLNRAARDKPIAYRET